MNISEIIRLQNADILVDFSNQEDAMIVSVVSIYDTYLEGLFSRLVFPPLFSSLGTIVVSRTFGTQDGDYRGTSIHIVVFRLV